MRNPGAEYFWYFDTFGVKSYLLLPRNFATYAPRRDREPSPFEHELIDRLARRYGGGEWRPEAGLMQSRRRRLKPGVAELDSAHPDPDVQYFLARNPSYAMGDRLPCLCALNATNVVSIVRRSAVRAVRNTVKSVRR